MIDVSELITDPDVAQPFIVFRQSGSWVAGRWVEGIPTQISMYGPVWVASERDLKQVPEGDRVEGAMMFCSTAPLYITRDGTGAGTSDQIQWDGEMYRVVKIFPWQKHGFYQAYAHRIKGS